MNLNMIRSGDKIFVNVVFNQPISWTQALTDALERGTTWTLASIQSQGEQAALMSVLSNKAWLGLRQDINTGDEPGGGWFWIDGTAVDFQNWGVGEPNDVGGAEHWGEINLSTFWNDMPNGPYNMAAVYQVSALSGFTLTGAGGTDRLLGGDGADTILARTGDDQINGGAGDDSINGGLGNNEIEGGLGNDTISSGGGDDRIIGGAGVDLLMAGSGADVFVFEEASDSARGAADGIRYFNDAADVIDFTTLSDTLHLSATTLFHQEAGEIVLRQQATRLLVLLDIDGDGQADMALRLGGTHALTEANFLIPVPVLE